MRQRDWFQTYFWLLKALYEVKPIGLQLTFNIFRCPSISHTIKNCIKLWADTDMFKLDISEKGLGMVTPPHFAYDFSSKYFSC